MWFKRNRKIARYLAHFAERFTADFQLISDLAAKLGYVTTYLDTAPSSDSRRDGFLYVG